MNTSNSTLSKTVIKKLVYKQQPIAKFEYIRIGVAYYSFNVSVSDKDEIKRIGFNFEIPVSDMGEADFGPEMEAKLLLRWLNETVIYFKQSNNE